MSTGRACVFCGSRPVTAEHVCPQWIGRNIRVQGSLVLTMGERQMREARALDLRVRAVCRSCNGGWLSDLEGAFSAKMLPAIDGRPVMLDETEQTMVATWAVKTWMLLEMALGFDRGWSVRVPGLFPFLYRERHPPREMSVWVGGLLPGHSTVAWLTTMLVNDPAVGVITIFTIGNLVFHLYYPFPPVRHELAIGPDLKDAFIAIWPHASAALEVPPAARFDIDDLNRIFLTGRINITIGDPGKDRLSGAHR